MHLFTIGDVHGCYHTLLQLLQQWNPDEELLIQVGDLIDRGNYAVEVIRHMQELQEKHPGKVVILRGNHEQMMIDYIENRKTADIWLFNGGNKTLEEFIRKEISLNDLLPWLRERPLKWENQSLLISHAGIAKNTDDPYDVHHSDGILWNRKQLKRLPKIQVIGHTPRQNGKASFSAASRHWNIDTGAYRGICLTGLKLHGNGNFIEEINIPTDERDFRM